MTLDEAIEHCKEKAEELGPCSTCAMEHQQLAAWLEELKRSRRPDISTRDAITIANLHRSVYGEEIITSLWVLITICCYGFNFPLWAIVLPGVIAFRNLIEIFRKVFELKVIVELVNGEKNNAN